MTEDWTTARRASCPELKEANTPGFFVCALKKGKEPPPVNNETACSGNPFLNHYIDCPVFKEK